SLFVSSLSILIRTSFFFLQLIRQIDHTLLGLLSSLQQLLVFSLRLLEFLLQFVDHWRNIFLYEVRILFRHLS
ncbi:hypothetical protein PMAYCL1PPCAC_26474, partial [Pristionchus mayeri]